MSSDRRLRLKRTAPARLAKRPVSLELTRRPDNLKPSDTMKAAVQAALTLGQPAEQIAQRFNLDLAMVKRWEKAYDISNPIKRRDDLSEKVLLFVEQELASLMAISIATSDEEWILNQTASELAEYISVKEDRLMAIFGAFSKAQQGIARITGETNGED